PLAVEVRVAPVDRVDPRNALDEGGLAGAIVADERHHLTGPHLEVDVRERLHRAEALRETACLERRSACTGRRWRCHHLGHADSPNWRRWAGGAPLGGAPPPCSLLLPSTCSTARTSRCTRPTS